MKSVSEGGVCLDLFTFGGEKSKYIPSSLTSTVLFVKYIMNATTQNVKKRMGNFETENNYVEMVDINEYTTYILTR